MDRETVDKAERFTRRRAGLSLLAAGVFVAAQMLALPRVFDAGGPATRLDWWAVTAVLFLALVATGGGLLNPAEVRRLVQDDVARANTRRAIAAGYWVAMGLGLGLYLGPAFHDLSARQAIYLIVTASVTVPLIVFAWLELRASG